MNNFSQSTKYQDDCEYNCSNYTPRHSRQSSKNFTSKHTNTPWEFMICLKCQEKISKKNQLSSNCAVGDFNRNMSEYSKALSYINSCHTIINEFMKQSKDHSDAIKLPDLPNFMDLFNTLANFHNVTGGDFTNIRQKTSHESRYNSDRSRSNSNESSNTFSQKLYQNKQQNREEYKVKHTKKGKFIELLPDAKHDKYKNQETYSPGTTESEESDLDLNISISKTGHHIVLPNKFKSKIRTAHEKVIYEEDSHDDDYVNTFKKDDEKVHQTSKDDTTNKKMSPLEHTRPIQNSPKAVRSKTLTTSMAPIGCNVSNNFDNTKKIKQRSSSSTTPREKPKANNSKKGLPQEVAGNFSDTAITSGNVAHTKKLTPKSLCTPIDMPNNELTQQELDKYAKELLGSESPSPRSPRSKSPAQGSFTATTAGTKTKIEQDKHKKLQKISSTQAVRPHLSDPKKKSCQEKQTSNGSTNNVNTSPKTSTVSNSNMQQKQEQIHSNQQHPKKYRKSYSGQQIEQQSQQQQNNVKKQSSCRKSNSYSSGASVLSVVTQTPTKGNIFGFGNMNQQCTGDSGYLRSRCEKSKISEIPEEEDDNKTSCRNDLEEDNCNLTDQLNLLCDNTETLSMHTRSCSQSGNKITSIPKAQYSITTKPNDFFTSNRKNNNMRIRCTKQDIEYDINVESDDIKTDSEIEEDHFEKDGGAPLSRKSSKNSGPSIKMSQVLSHLGLLPNSQMPPETEQMINEVKSTRAHDERNRPFREPRKVDEDPNEHIVKIEERRMRDVYATESVTQLCRTLSEESSDIKSDEDVYNSENRVKTTSFNYCLGNNRYQT